MTGAGALSAPAFWSPQRAGVRRVACQRRTPDQRAAIVPSSQLISAAAAHTVGCADRKYSTTSACLRSKAAAMHSANCNGQPCSCAYRITSYMPIPSSTQAGVTVPRAAMRVRVPQHPEVPSPSSTVADVTVPRAAVLVRVPQHL
eukprot:CAMPEP_0179846876 /NCGR_PEP_ID=MMETSP0982-20121206/5783_1 /TAXON_ID=483367 /ORGANISM="non described non described, Strain CCMP 2436" /LENGTH=144 /DNA_ID=CAMNT_0021732023 /DNA_START=78 /DNA_END=508 /DNA_ORIENTATION=+